MKEEKRERSDSATDYIQSKLFDILYAISKRGTVQEKILGVVLMTAMESMDKSPGDKSGIDSILNKILEIAEQNESLKKGYIDKEDMSLMNYGVLNAIGLLDAYSTSDERSAHIYHSLHAELEASDSDLQTAKSNYIASRIEELNEKVEKNEIAADEVSSEVKKIVDQANEKFGGDDEVEIIRPEINHEDNLKNRLSEEIFNVYNKFNTAVVRKYKSNKDSLDNQENYFAINILKALMMVHRLSMTREMADHIGEHNEFYAVVTHKINEIAKKSGMSGEDFFRVKKYSDEEISKMEDDILNDPDVDQNIKDLLGGINLN